MTALLARPERRLPGVVAPIARPAVVAGRADDPHVPECVRPADVDGHDVVELLRPGSVRFFDHALAAERAEGSRCSELPLKPRCHVGVGCERPTQVDSHTPIGSPGRSRVRFLPHRLTRSGLCVPLSRHLALGRVVPVATVRLSFGASSVAVEAKPSGLVAYGGRSTLDALDVFSRPTVMPSDVDHSYHILHGLAD